MPTNLVGIFVLSKQFVLKELKAFVDNVEIVIMARDDLKVAEFGTKRLSLSKGKLDD